MWPKTGKSYPTNYQDVVRYTVGDRRICSMSGQYNSKKQATKGTKRKMMHRRIVSRSIWPRTGNSYPTNYRDVVKYTVGGSRND
jgi:nucleoid DNA-binding protein